MDGSQRARGSPHIAAQSQYALTFEHSRSFQVLQPRLRPQDIRTHARALFQPLTFHVLFRYRPSERFEVLRHFFG